ncbi:DUF1217 domain-containing protein [Aestuariivirga sp.]|uniref:DUF1217 domain-containing protein n=1 Tax=Aestuariivirga sp. TaxID=2650926 RepID=UPI0039E4C551
MTTITDYRQISANLDRSLAAVASRADVKRDSGYYLANISNVKSVDDFLKDERLYRYAMTAFGLKDMIYGKAFIRKVLTEGIDSNNAFALQLSDSRFRDFAEAFNFQRYGATATAFTRAQQGTVDKYLRVELETDAGTKDQGVQLALYFQRQAANVTSVYGLMGDTALYKVVQTALGLPAAMSNLDIDKQAAYISSKIDLDDLKTTDGMDKFLSRFAAKWQMANDTSSATVPQIGLSQSLLTTIGNDTLLSLQNLKSGIR